MPMPIRIRKTLVKYLILAGDIGDRHREGAGGGQLEKGHRAGHTAQG
jgi:hypothetical protein